MELEKELNREVEMYFETCELYKAIKAKTIETPVKTLAAISDGDEDINARNIKEETFLHLIAQMFERDSDAPYLLPVVFQLSNAGSDVSAVDRDGNTALHIAAKTTGSRKLIRALLMVGCDPSLKNVDKQLPAQLARSIPDNLKILEEMTPDLWEAVSRRDKVGFQVALSNWVTVTQERDKETLMERAERIGYDDILNLLQTNRRKNEFVHFCLAGDRQKMRPLLGQNADVNTTSLTFIDTISGEYLIMPLIGECALLGLDSVVRKLVRKSANACFSVDDIPVYLYILKNMPPQKQFFKLIETMLSKIDFQKRQGETTAVLDAAYEKKVPMDVVRTMATSGLDLFAVDDDGRFLRDRILIKNVDQSPKKLDSELTFVDNMVVDIASFGLMDVLRRLIQRNYEHIEVTNQDGLTSRQALAKAKGEIVAKEFFEWASETLKRHRNICRVIDIGHLAQFQNLLTSQVAMVTDKRGRTLFHRAVLFERRHMVRLLVKVCPEQAKVADTCGRTPLHWACLITENEEIEDMLLGLRCRRDVQDKSGATPADFKAFSAARKRSMLEGERRLDPGLDVYLYYRYLAIKEAIRAGDLHRVEEIRGGMYQDVPFEDLHKRMYRTDPPPLDLLQMAVDARRDVIAKFLLTSGMPWDVKVTDGKEEITLLEAAKRKEMKAVANYINFQLQQKEDQAALISKLKNIGKRR